MSAGVLPSVSFLVTVMLLLGRSPAGVGVEPTMIPPAKAEAAAGRFAVTVLWRIVMWSAPRVRDDVAVGSCALAYTPRCLATPCSEAARSASPCVVVPANSGSDGPALSPSIPDGSTSPRSPLLPDGHALRPHREIRPIPQIPPGLGHGRPALRGEVSKRLRALTERQHVRGPRSIPTLNTGDLGASRAGARRRCSVLSTRSPSFGAQPMRNALAAVSLAYATAPVVLQSNW